MSKKQIITLFSIIGVGVLLIVIMVAALIPDSQQETVTVTRGGVPVTTLDIKTTDPVSGRRNASVLLFVFSDFGCDNCAKVAPVLKQLVERNKNVGVVWKDLPVTNYPAPSTAAHIAARCAQQQNKFWEYHDMLFSNESAITEAALITIAEKLNLKKERFQTCLSEKKLQPLIDANLELARSMGIDGVPYFFIGDERFSGNRTLEYFEAAVKRATL